ncbi:unnamed protein product [Amoebophrya sp. A25]|nr:unnamed protein product [Amoebophrya sp. A25]|eukprot:GSA25T00023137001.1
MCLSTNFSKPFLSENGTIVANPCLEDLFKLPSDTHNSTAAQHKNTTAVPASIGASDGAAVATSTGEEGSEATKDAESPSSGTEVVDPMLDIHPTRAAGYLDRDFAAHTEEPSPIDGISAEDWYYFLLTEQYSLRAMFYTTTLDKAIAFSVFLLPTLLFFAFLAG